MSQTASITKNYSHGGKTFNETTTITSELSVAGELSVPAAQAGVLTVRTSDVAGSITMDSASHTVTTGDRISIFWTPEGVIYVATVGTVAGQVVPFTLAEGDILPAATTAVQVALPEELPAVFAGDDVAAVTLFSAVIGAFVFTGSDNATDWARVLLASKSHQWNPGEDEVNPVAGDAVTKVYVSHGNAAPQIMRFAVLYD